MVASVPELQKRTRSTLGRRSHKIAASSCWQVVGDPKSVPLAACSWIAATTAG